MNAARWSRIPGARARKLLRVLYGPEAQIAAELQAAAPGAAKVSPPVAASLPHPLPRPHFASNRPQDASARVAPAVVTAP